IEIAAKRSEPFDVLLRVHSYATQPGEVRAGLTVPRGWKTGVAVPLKFDATGDRYARLTVTPPLKLAKGNFKISAYVERGTGRGLPRLISIQRHRDRRARLRTSAGVGRSEPAVAGLCVQGWNARRAVPARVCLGQIPVRPVSGSDFAAASACKRRNTAGRSSPSAHH